MQMATDRSNAWLPGPATFTIYAEAYAPVPVRHPSTSSPMSVGSGGEPATARDFTQSSYQRVSGSGGEHAATRPEVDSAWTIHNTKILNFRLCTLPIRGCLRGQTEIIARLDHLARKHCWENRCTFLALCFLKHSKKHIWVSPESLT